MAYPISWTCPSCGSVVYNSVKCTTCGYQPPNESGSLESSPLQENLLKTRIIAFLIDIGFIIGIGIILSIMTASFLTSQLGKDINELIILFMVPINSLLIFLHPIYFFLLEGIYSQTYGKKIMHLIVTSDGKKIGIKKSLIRNSTRFIEALFLYIPSIIKIKKENKRWGDVLAGTSVIKE